jgi:hypothetical protein
VSILLIDLKNAKDCHKPCIKYVEFVPVKQRQIFNIIYPLSEEKQGWAALPSGELIYLQLFIWSPIQVFNQAQL